MPPSIDVGTGAPADAVVPGAAAQRVVAAGADQQVIVRAAPQHHRADESGGVERVAPDRAVDVGPLDVREDVEEVMPCVTARTRRRRP